jgi:hypothetical protein
MVEPVDPAVLGVASALKSLRTRAGLREGRLHGTELVLDTLTGLDGVRVLISAGESPERAIVRAVQVAVGTLEPTMSIIADVSLGLELSAELIPDAHLYAQGLGQRREALLRNWDRLHELRSVIPRKAPSPRALRLEMEAEALTALARTLVRGDGSGTVTRASVSPDEAQTRQFQMGAAPAGPAGSRSRPDRRGSRLVLVPSADPMTPTLFQTFQHVAKALRDCLVRDADGRPAGWPRFLHESPGQATAASTAYGIRAMLLLEGGLAADLIPVAENLAALAFPRGGFANLGQSGPRLEATAAVLSALRRISATEDFDVHASQMERDLGDFEKARPFILTLALETGLLLRPESKLVETLIGSLLAARRPYGDLLLWPEKADPSLIDPAPSVAHTARAVRALACVQTIRPASQVNEALEQAVAWLSEQRDLANSYELIERRLDDGLEVVHTRHFTAAWVVKGLVSAGVPTAHPAVSDAVARIWTGYRSDITALWAWDNGDLPIWMTFDAIEALCLASLAALSRFAW